ncbi:helix-turn-helix domain-containing protein [Zymobacter palmae]|uniref:Predicted Zn peptidase n=1 Tax=Zymobacter palmae TaxID=33074 RepID=A0A348HFP1_9GAMM|nr:XRE family transcriptional regulator [Zymobacter palmae]BBG30443.1 predicted Zn peptidase [Zymobacter palmae]
MFSTKSLEIARERRGLTKKQLAESVNISAEHLTRIIKEKHCPESELISTFSKVLGYPLEFFVSGPEDVLSEENVSFRDLSSSTARDRKRTKRAGDLAIYINSWMINIFSLPPVNLPDLRDENQNPEVAASSLRSLWGIGNRPIPNLIKLLENKGIRLMSLDEDNVAVDGFSFYVRNQPYIMINNSKSAERSRFNLAHELAHLVLHLHGGDSGTGEKDCTCNTKKVEAEADQFASAFLMPRDDILDNLPIVRNIDHLIEAKKRWRVSVAALARRCYQLGIVSDWKYRALCKEISVRGYRRNEPNPTDRETSIIWNKIMMFLFKEKNKTDGLHLPVDEWDTLVQGLLKKDINNSLHPITSDKKLSLQLVR